MALEWTKTLKAKPVKCRALAFRLFRWDEKSTFKKVLSTLYSCFDPLLTMAHAILRCLNILVVVYNSI